MSSNGGDHSIQLFARRGVHKDEGLILPRLQLLRRWYCAHTSPKIGEFIRVNMIARTRREELCMGVRGWL